jgi:tRNA threonylcarbamoyladenosine biosynthesis protein TsaE
VKEIRSGNAAETFSIGARLGRLLEPGDFIALIGNLGAGKTQFVKGVAVGLGLTPEEPVTSPTYTLLNIHVGRFPLYHFDLYRLVSEDDIINLGFEEYVDSAGVCVVEWAERLGDLIPGEHLSVFLSVEDVDSRLIRFEPSGSRAEELVRRLFVS